MGGMTQHEKAARRAGGGGVKRISLATSLYRAAMTGFLEAITEVRDTGQFGFLDRCVTTRESRLRSRQPPRATVRQALSAAAVFARSDRGETDRGRPSSAASPPAGSRSL